MNKKQSGVTIEFGKESGVFIAICPKELGKKAWGIIKRLKPLAELSPGEIVAYPLLQITRLQEKNLVAPS